MSSQPAYDSTHQRRKVTFGWIEVCEHVYEMGDHPEVSDGCPLTVGWELQSKRAFDIAYFETYFPSEERRRETSMKLSVADRAKILLRQGYTMNEIVECTLKVMQEKRKRDKSIQKIKWDGWYFLKEKTARKLNKATRLRRRSSMDHFQENRKATSPPPPPPILEVPSLSQGQARGRRSRRVSIGPACGSATADWVPFSPLKSPANKKKMRVSTTEENQDKVEISLDGTHVYQIENLPPLDAFIRDFDLGNTQQYK